MTNSGIAQSYNTIVRDTQSEQIHFMRHGRYRHSSFDDVAASVYFDSEYMRKYMCGLAISSFLWPNHNAMHHFFLEHLPRDARGTYLEVGPGHGYYFMKSAVYGEFQRLLGVDISPTSIAMTRSILDHYGIGDDENRKIELIEADFLRQEIPADNISVVVMGEVLEHVEQPQEFIARLRDLANDQTTLYITTCVNAPAVDHIFLYRSIGEVESMLEQGGLRIERSLHVPYAGKTLAQCEKQKLAINVAYFLTRR